MRYAIELLKGQEELTLTMIKALNRVFNLIGQEIQKKCSSHLSQPYTENYDS